MPRYPVYANLLPDSARAVIGEVHDDTRAARAMLEQEGFRYEGYVDIFDAGPDARMLPRRHSRDAGRSAVLPVHLGEEDPVPDSLTDDIRWLVANRRFDDFRVILAHAPSRVDRFPLLPYAATALGVADGDRCAPCRCRRRTAVECFRGDAADGPRQLRRHPGSDAQLRGARARQPRGGAQRATGRESARGGAAGTRQGARARRARASRRPCCRRTSVRTSARCARSDFPAPTATSLYAPRAKRRSFSPHARRRRRCGPRTPRP